MPEVEATQRGYWGAQIRDTGDRFVIDDEIMSDKKRRPSWVKLVKAKAKADADAEADDAEADKPAKGGRKVKPATAGPVPSTPFDDAPEPVELKGNGVKDALPVEPDWVAPKPID